MATQSLIQTGSRSFTERNNATGVTTYSSDRVRSYWRQFGSSGLIRGDFKSPNPWSYNVLQQVYANGRYIFSIPSTTTTVEGSLSGDTTFCPSLSLGNRVNNVTNDALGRLNGKVRGSLDLATSLAESGQTGKMLNLVKRLTDGMTDMKRSWKREILNKLRSFKSRRSAAKALRRWQRGIKARYPGSYRPRPNPPGMVEDIVNQNSKRLANGWCEYTYGWNPLISDIRGIAENVVGFAHKKCAVRASATQQIDETSNVASALFNWSGNAKVVYTGFVKVVFGVRLNVGFDDSLARWTSLNPATVAWELVPYSFVVDWIFDLGSYMRNLETSLLYACFFKDGYQSTLTRYTATASISDTRRSGSSSATVIGQGGLTVTSFNRSKLISYPTPRAPSFKLDLGSNQLLSAAALLRQLLR